MIDSLLTSAARTPLLTGYPLTGRYGIPFRPSSQYFSTVPINRTSQPGCQTPPTSIPCLMTLPCRYSSRRGSFGVVLPFRALPAHLLSLPPPLPSVRLLGLPPHFIWWGIEDPPASPPEILGTTSCSSPMRALPSVAYPSITKGCGEINLPQRIPPGLPGICPCPRHNTPCSGPERSRTRPPTSWLLTDESVWP